MDIVSRIRQMERKLTKLREAEDELRRDIDDLRRQIGMGIPIEVLDLKVRTFNGLKRGGIHDVQAAIALANDPVRSLGDIRDFGQKSYEDLVTQLRAKGWSEALERSV